MELRLNLVRETFEVNLGGVLGGVGMCGGDQGLQASGNNAEGSRKLPHCIGMFGEVRYTPFVAAKFLGGLPP